jgi:hypothetical protein
MHRNGGLSHLIAETTNAIIKELDDGFVFKLLGPNGGLVSAFDRNIDGSLLRTDHMIMY